MKYDWKDVLITVNGEPVVSTVDGKPYVHQACVLRPMTQWEKLKDGIICGACLVMTATMTTILILTLK